VQLDEAFYGGGRSVEVNVLPSGLFWDEFGAVCDGISNLVLKGLCGVFGEGLEVFVYEVLYFGVVFLSEENDYGVVVYWVAWIQLL
jgi:hypothetical protein